MKLAPLVCTSVLVALVALGTTTRARALYCGSHLVERGDAMARVRQYCGEPATAVSRTEVRTGYGAVAGVTYGVPIVTTVQIDTWTYDFGPMRFMEEITFENGVVLSSRPMGYGTRSGNDRGGMNAADRPAPRLVPPRPRDGLGGL